MGLISGLIKLILKLVVFISIFIAAIVIIPNLPPYANYSVIKLESTLPYEGPLALNDALNNAKKLYNGKLLGPEAFQVFNDEVYTSLATGEIVKLSSEGHVTFVTKVGQPCSGLTQEEKCGRPLGFAIDEKKKQLYVCDAYHGLWKVDLTSDKKQLLVSPDVEIEGVKPKLFNGLALHQNGDIYWTHSSAEFDLQNGALVGLVDPSGRLLHYDAAKKTSKVLLDKLWFANGVVISPDYQFVLVVETMGHRIHKVFIDGPKKGKSEVFIAGLPGAPDNMRVLPNGSGVLVALYSVAEPGHPLISQSLTATPIIRKFLARLHMIFERTFEFLNSVYPHFFFEQAVYMNGHISSLKYISPGLTALTQIDWSGKIVATYYNTDSSVNNIGEAIVFKDQLLLGSPHSQDYVGAVPVPPQLKSAFQTKAKHTQSKPVESKTAEKKPVDKPKAIKVEPKKVETKPAENKIDSKTAEKKAEHKTPEKKIDVKPVEKKVVPETVEKKINPKSQEREPETKPTPKKAEEKLDAKHVEKKVNQKPAEKKVQPQVEVPKKNKDAVKDTKYQNTEPEKSKAKDKNVKPEAAKKTAIPITEELPSDTIKPQKETLKVIKKTGPVEIPNPEL